jgi:hypothetical protein
MRRRHFDDLVFGDGDHAVTLFAIDLPRVGFAANA